MRKTSILLIICLLVLACQKEKEVKVQYIVSKAASGFDLSYLNEEGSLVAEWVPTASAEERWTYAFSAEEGDIVYVSARYYDISSAISVMILIDGKVYKQGSSMQDTTRFVTVSGTVPF